MDRSPLEGVWDMLHSSGQYFNESFRWKYKESAYQIVDSTKNGRKKATRQSTWNTEEAVPKWIQRISGVLLALTFYELISWNEEPRRYDETWPTTQVQDREGVA